jgi:hypothetical protein
VAPPGNQAVNGESKLQPDISGETGLLDSIYRQSAREVYQKNLGSNTTKIAREMKSYNPDKTWTPAEE